MTELVIKDLHVSVEDKEILKGLNLTIRSGERHALMGPNGIDEEIVKKIIDIFSNVCESKEYGEFCDSLGIQLNIKSGEDFQNYITEIYSGLEKASKELFV